MIPDRMGTRLGAVAVLLLLATGTGLADQYWVAYEANDYPEDVGWQRYWSGQPAERSLEDGCLVLDMLTPGMAEWYRWYRDEMDPGPGESFVMRWRLRVDEVNGYSGPLVMAVSDDHSVAGFKFHENMVRDAYHGGVEAYFEPGIYHEFELRSNDMVNYELYIDDQLALQHHFLANTSLASRASWGHAVTGITSLTRWDYVRFGVVPEPSVGTGLLTAVALSRRPRRRGHKR